MVDINAMDSSELAELFKSEVKHDEAFKSQEELFEEVARAITTQDLDILAANVATGNGKTEVARVLMKATEIISNRNYTVVFTTPNNQLLSEMEEISKEEYFKNSEVTFLVVPGKNNFVCKTAKEHFDKGKKITLNNGQKVSVKQGNTSANYSPSKQYGELFDYDKYGACCNYRHFEKTDESLEDVRHCEYLARRKIMADILDGKIKGAIATNIDHFISSSVYEKDLDGNKRDIDLLLVDEADVLRPKVQEHAKIKLPASHKRTLKANGPEGTSQGIETVEPRPEVIEGDDREQKKEEVKKAFKGYIKRYRDALDTMQDRQISLSQFDLQKNFQDIKSNFFQLKTYIDRENQKDEILTYRMVDGNDGFLEVIPQNVSYRIQDILENVDTTIMMSATITRTNVKLLGLEEEINTETVYINDERDNLTDKNTNIIFPQKCSGMLKTGDNQPFEQDGFQKTMKFCKKIFDIHKMEKGILHVSSYAKRDTVMDYLETTSYWQRTVTHPKSGEDENLRTRKMGFETFKEAEEPLIMIAVRKYRGINLKQDQSRFNIVFNVPYPVMNTDQFEAKKDYYDHLLDENTTKAYNSPAVTETILQDIQQATGRTTRTKWDFSTTYIVDRRFGFFWNSGDHPGKERAVPWFERKLTQLRADTEEETMEMVNAEISSKHNTERRRVIEGENAEVLFETEKEYREYQEKIKTKPLHSRINVSDVRDDMSDLDTDDSIYTDMLQESEWEEKGKEQTNEVEGQNENLLAPAEEDPTKMNSPGSKSGLIDGSQFEDEDPTKFGE